MTRYEYNEYRYIRKTLKQFVPGYGTTLTTRVDGSTEYKRKLHELYSSYGFHPAGIRADERFFLDSGKRIVYVYGLTFDFDGADLPWNKLYSKDELEAFEKALQ